MRRVLKPVLIAAGAIVGVVAGLYLLAWALMPTEWIGRQALRQASQVKGAAIRWNRLTPALEGLALGVKLQGLSIRIPDTGPPKTDARITNLFVRLKLLPLLFRRVEVSSAKVDGAWITMSEPARPDEEAPPESLGVAKFSIRVPRLDFENINVRTRDPFGTGTEIKGLSGSTDLTGMLDAPTSIRLAAKAESLFWKPSARGGNVALPSPLEIDLMLKPKEDKRVLRVTKGTVNLGSITSAVSGTVAFPRSERRPGPVLDLTLTGKSQELKSDDEAWKALTSKIPAEWSAKASWTIRATGRPPDIVTDGAVTMRPLSVKAEKNSFSFEQLRAVWNTRADRTFTASAEGAGSGVALSMEAKGSVMPGSATTGVLTARAPAMRLNGLLPNTPVWQSGDVELRAVFELDPPAEPRMRWVARGRGIDGKVQGLERPVRGLEFDIEGDNRQANVRSIRLGVGSTTIRAGGTIQRGKPLSTGTFHIGMDRLIAEEWAPPAGGKAPEKVAAPHPAQLPMPLGAFAGDVEIGEVRSGGMRITNLSAPVRFDGQTLTAAPIAGSLGSGSIEGRLVIQSLFSSPKYTLHLDAKRVPVDQVAAGTIPFTSAVTGLLSGVIELSGDGLPSPKPNDSLRGLLKGSVEDGKLRLSPPVAAVLQSLGLRRSGDIALREETHSLRIVGQKMIVDRISGDLEEDKAEMTGTVGLDRSLDLNLLLRLASVRVKQSTVIGQLARFARDAEGRVPVAIKITGFDRAPKISLNPAGTVDVAAKQFGRDLANQMFQRLLGKRDSVPPAAQKPDTSRKADTTGAAAKPDTTRKVSQAGKGDSAAVDPLQKARDALKQIFRK